MPINLLIIFILNKQKTTLKYQAYKGGIMKKIILMSILLFTCCSLQAGTYTQYKKQVRNTLVKCLKDPENYKFSAAFNGCVLEASDDFMKRSTIEFNKQYQVANARERGNLIKDKIIYTNAIKSCEGFQDLSYDGFTTEAICKLHTARNYLSLLTNGAGSYSDSWTLEDRVDNLFIGY